MLESISIFKTAYAKARYFAAYDAVLELWSVPYESRYVTTRFGKTHIVVSGSVDAPSLVLLHPQNMSATVWFPNVAELSRAYRVYAIDTLCDLGKSLPSTFLNSRHLSAEWLREVLEGLHLERTNMIGGSYGGWLTLNLAIHFPDYLRRIVVLSPAASFIRVNWKTYLAIAKESRDHPEWALNAFVMSGYPINARFRHQIATGINGFVGTNTKVAWATVFSDEQLQRIDIPVLVLYGAQEPFCRPRKALENACRLLPQVEAELIPDAGHLLSMDRAEAVNARILRFLNSS